MSIDFPSSPTVGQTYPSPPVTGVPVYTWDGTKWGAAAAATPSVPSGSVLPFFQAAAPSGWTKLTTHNDKALRIVSGSGGVAGGTNSFSSVMAQTATGNHTLVTTELASHFHVSPSAINYSTGTLYSAFASGGLGPMYYGVNTNTAGGDGAHNHSITMSIQYVDVILCSKN